MRRTSPMTLGVLASLWGTAPSAHAGPPGGIDSWTPHQVKAGPSRVSDVLAIGAGVGAVGTGLVRGVESGEWVGLGASGGTLAVTLGLTEATKRLSNRRRPYTWDPEHPAVGVPGYCSSSAPLTPDDCKSFFSGHTALAAASSFSAVRDLQLRGGLTARRDLRLAYGTALVVTLSTATLRVMAGKHYVTDVAVGALVGTGLGVLGPTLAY